MSALEIVVIIGCVLVVGGVAIGSIVRKKKAKANGCTSCAGCPYCESCRAHTKQTTQESK